MSNKYITNNYNRRDFLKTTTATAGAITLSAPFIRKAWAAEPLKVATYGGYFEESFNKYIYPDFTKETGIMVESIAEPTGEAWLVQLQNAARAGQAPADVSMMAQIPRLKGHKAKLWAPLNEAKIPNFKNLPENFVDRYDDETISGVGAVFWYITLVSNTDRLPEAPTSWKSLWDPSNKDSLGLLSLITNSFLLEVTAKTWFGGTQFLDSRQNIMIAMNKLAELKPNVRLWYRDEGQFQQALEVGEIAMGQYYHDVTGIAASEGKPVRSTFPVEGGILDSGSWCVSKASQRIEEAQVFINYMCQPSIQARLSRYVGTAPAVNRQLTDLTEEEFNAVSSDITPIIPRYDLYSADSDWLTQKWSEVIAA